MTHAITSIQRNRAPWLLEWLAFHMVVGFDRFYIYLHRCEDGSAELLTRLARHYPVQGHVINLDVAAQQRAYQHAWDAHGADVTWMAFIDGDEFLHPTRDATIGEALARFAPLPVSAVAAYWMCYGSSGHLDEPDGLVLENFTRHALPGFNANQHVKTIVRGGEPGVACHSAHLFHTPRGTVDDRLRPIHRGWMPDTEPSWDLLRINHYVTQSFGYFQGTKQRSGAADGSAAHVRPDSWFEAHDRNEADDGMRWRWLLPVKRQVREMRLRIGLPA